jgi:hypothetical protein
MKKWFKYIYGNYDLSKVNLVFKSRQLSKRIRLTDLIQCKICGEFFNKRSFLEVSEHKHKNNREE